MPRRRSSAASSSAEPVVVDLLDSDDDDEVGEAPADGGRRRCTRRNRPAATEELFSFPLKPAKGEESVTIRYGDLRRLRPPGFEMKDMHRAHTEELLLNDNLVDFYVKYLSNDAPASIKHLLPGLSANFRERVHIFSSFFLKKLKEKINRRQDLTPLLRWCDRQGVNLLEKDFIFVPVHEERMAGHWALAIICFPGLVTKQRDHGEEEALAALEAAEAKDRAAAEAAAAAAAAAAAETKAKA